jgi:hypothetical protein
MPRTPFEIAFDHAWDECQSEPRCDFAASRLCPIGQALFDAAHDICQRFVDLDTPKAKA